MSGFDVSVLELERAEARAARELGGGWRERPTLQELAGERGRDRYEGRCGGCGEPVSARMEGGSCLWRGGPWHPACREEDRAAGGTAYRRPESKEGKGSR